MTFTRFRGVRGSKYVSGVETVAAASNKIAIGAELIFAKRRIEKQLVEKVKQRFESPETNPNAQRSPSGRFWKFPAKSTIARSRKNNMNPRQSLYDFGGLQDSIGIIKGNTLNIGKGKTAIADVGVRRGFSTRSGVPYTRFANFLQQGGTTPTGGVVPARPFIGVAKRDVKEIQDEITRIMNKQINS